MTDVMLDIETLGTDQDAVTTQIAAVAFNPYCYEAPSVGFNSYINFNDQHDRSISLETLEFWAKQPNNLFLQMLAQCSKAPNLDDVLINLYSFLKEVRPGRVWANGITFDLSIIQNAAEERGLPVYWLEGMGYRMPRCMRGLKEIAFAKNPLLDLDDQVKHRLKVWKRDDGLAHDALYDCNYQSAAVQLMYQSLGMKRPGT